MADQLLGEFTSGMDRRTRRGGKNGPQQLWSLINGYIDAKKQVVPRPGLRHVADVANSVGLYGYDGQLHVFHSGDEGFADPGNPLVQPHIVRYPNMIPAIPPPNIDAFGLEVLNDHPLIYLPLKESVGTVANDLSGNGRNGSYVGSVVHSSEALRTGSRSTLFGDSGAGAYVTVPDDGWGSIFPANAWSIQVIAKKVGIIAGSADELVAKFISPNIGSSSFSLHGNPFTNQDKMVGQYFDLDTAACTIASPDLTLTDTHIFVLAKDATTFYLYVDGELSTSHGYDQIGQNNDSLPLTIGGEQNFPNSYQFYGYLSDVSVYDHALSDSRILTLAQAAGLHA